MKKSIGSFLALLPLTIAFGELPEPRFEAVTIDDKIQIGYGVAVADVDGDKRPDILLADKKQFVWYRNPGADKAAAPGGWQKFVIAENLTEKDNVCLAAQDIDGDGKCEVAVGAEWNPGDTVNSGAVFYMIAPADRTQRWTPVKLHAEPTTHRMRWIKLSRNEVKNLRWGLVVVPLHGRGNKNGEGEGVKVLLYHPPAQLNDPKAQWQTELICDSMHMTHNFNLLPPEAGSTVTPITIAGREGLQLWRRPDDAELAPPKGWIRGDSERPFPRGLSPAGAGEVREGYHDPATVTGSTGSNTIHYYATVEPMHGNQLCAYMPLPPSFRDYQRVVLTDKLTEGHALACGNLLGVVGSEQVVVGWRGIPGKAASTHGIHLWALEEKGEKWRESAVDDGGMACEDLTLADLDGDGKLDIVASGRATKNVKVYFNRTAKAR